MTFITDRGVAVPAVTTEEMREVDRIAVEETGPNLFQMMENAGRNLAATAIEMLGADWRTAPVVVLAGTGGNGGGGLAAGRHLANRGVAVTAVLVDEPRPAGVTRAQLDLYRHAGGEVSGAAGAVDEAALIVDAIVGYGLLSAPRGRVADLISFADASPAPVLALDVPSGVDATSGETPGVAVCAAATMTLALPKTGLAAPGVGALYLADIGIPAEVYRRLGWPAPVEIFDERWVVPITPDPIGGADGRVLEFDKRNDER